MILKKSRTIAFFMWLCQPIVVMAHINAQDASSPAHVKIGNLNDIYGSCELVTFSVKNISEEEIYVEVYAERADSGSWKDIDYQHDIKDPQSLYVKRVLVRPDMMKSGATLRLTYDRCLQPTFVKEDGKAFRRKFIEQDKKAITPTQQRLRVEVYERDGDHVKFVQRIWSEPFKRTVEK